jgi:superfamily II DNA/RNA helicase
VHRIGRTGRAGASGLAVSFAASSDQRLVADIEKLIKTKIELEPLEFEENLPHIKEQGRINDGRRMYRGNDGEPRDAQDAPRERRERRDYAPQRQAARDPFFDKPYESSLPVEAQPAWEEAVKSGVSRSLSANIKPKKKVAALFKTAG